MSSVTVSTGPSLKRSRTTIMAKPASRGRGKRTKAYTRAAVVRQGKGFPTKINQTLRYFDYAIATATQSTVVGSWWRANGIFDPQVSLGGHQPLGFDQLMAIYDHWVVKSSRIKVTFTYRDEVDDTSHPILCGIYDDDDAVNTLSYSALVEGCDRPKIDYLTTNNDKVVLYSKWTNTKTFGPATQSDPSQRGSSTSDPTETHNWFVFTYNLGNQNHTVNITYDIEYNCDFFELRDLAGS